MNIIITGASSGIGRELAYLYAKNNNLCILGRNKTELKITESACKLLSDRVDSFVCDLGEAETMRKFARDYIAENGYPDLIICNAGARLEECSDFSDSFEIARDLMCANYYSVINTISGFISESHPVHIVIISSIAALRATQNSGAYSASKAAVDRWAESLRLRIIKHGSIVTVINLGFVKTKMTEGLSFGMPGILSADKAAKKILRTINHRWRNLIIPWQSTLIFGAFYLMPGKMYDLIISYAKSRQK